MTQVNRPAILGDLLASLGVGGGLWWAWRGHSGMPPLAIGSGFLLPLIVYRFSTWWNALPFDPARALRLMLAMGSLFFLVHLPGAPPPLRALTGFVAPLFVSWRARSA